MINSHKHLCRKCFVVWEHPDPDDSMSNECYDLNHACPKCGRDQRWKYHGNAKTDYKFVSSGKYELMEEVASGKV